MNKSLCKMRGHGAAAEIAEAAASSDASVLWACRPSCPACSPASWRRLSRGLSSTRTCSPIFRCAKAGEGEKIKAAWRSMSFTFAQHDDRLVPSRRQTAVAQGTFIPKSTGHTAWRTKCVSCYCARGEEDGQTESCGGPGRRCVY
jgi:hypothetical protein